MTDSAEAAAVMALLGQFHTAFAAGDAERLAGHFTEDGRLYLLHSEPALGREAIRDRLGTGFERFDTSAWAPETQLTELRGDRAMAFSTYTERLLDRQSGARTLVRGRLVHWMALGPDGTWRIMLLMNSHAYPMEPIP